MSSVSVLCCTAQTRPAPKGAGRANLAKANPTTYASSTQMQLMKPNMLWRRRERAASGAGSQSPPPGAVARGERPAASRGDAGSANPVKPPVFKGGGGAATAPSGNAARRGRCRRGDASATAARRRIASAPGRRNESNGLFMATIITRISLSMCKGVASLIC